MVMVGGWDAECVCAVLCDCVVIKYRLIEKDCNNNKRLSTANVFVVLSNGRDNK